jgi:hypothetical protein
MWLRVQTTATIPPIPAVTVKVRILQDFKDSTAVTFTDRSYTQNTMTSFYPDDLDTGCASKQSTDANGNTICTVSDSPHRQLTAPVANNALNYQQSSYARDFILLTVGNSAEVVVGEVDWYFSIGIDFTPSRLGGASQYNGSERLQPTPQPNFVIAGGATILSPIPPPRTPTANTYTTSQGNWHPSGSNQMANKYTYPLQKQQ